LQIKNGFFTIGRVLMKKSRANVGLVKFDRVFPYEHEVLMIKVEGLSRSFGEIKAVKNVSFSVNKGEILGFIGPNGAGKSTTMRMITGYLSPSSGSVEIEGKALADNESLCKKMIGYLPESAPMYGDMTVLSFLDFCCDIRGMKRKERKEATARVIKDCFLEKVRYQTIGTLSKGFRQRTCFAQSILHDPPILILDEPTDGLDPNQKFEIRKVIRNFGRDKVIILSTHILEEVESLCTRVILISNGEIKADDSIEDFKARGPSLSETFRLLTNGRPQIDTGNAETPVNAENIISDTEAVNADIDSKSSTTPEQESFESAAGKDVSKSTEMPDADSKVEEV
jgi:ABC-2 type transport system ATP-binding protein